MQNANKSEEAPRRIDIKLGLSFEPFLQNPRAFVVDPTPRHINGFDLAGRQLFHRIKVTLANLEVVLHNLTKWPERQVKLCCRVFLFRLHVKNQASLANGQKQSIGSIRHLAIFPFWQLEGVVL